MLHVGLELPEVDGGTMGSVERGETIPRQTLDKRTMEGMDAEKEQRYQKDMAQAVQYAVGKAVEDAKVNHEKEKNDLIAAKDAAKVAR